jgi:hypothetical protein
VLFLPSDFAQDACSHDAILREREHTRQTRRSEYLKCTPDPHDCIAPARWAISERQNKPLVGAMFKAELGTCSVNDYIRLVLLLVRSVKDPETSEPVHRLKWNRENLGLPKIVKDEQHVPAAAVAVAA